MTEFDSYIAEVKAAQGFQDLLSLNPTALRVLELLDKIDEQVSAPPEILVEVVREALKQSRVVDAG